MGETYLFNYEDGTSKSLYDSLSLVTELLQDSYKFPINFLSRDYRTPINLLSKDSKTPIKRLQDFYQEITTLL